MYDPFRIQLLTLSLDSQLVLLLVGVGLAALAARQGARRAGLPPTGFESLALDGLFWVIIAGRIPWVLVHLEYYLRLPLQVVVVTDGGFYFGAGLIGGALYCWRLRRELGVDPGRLALVVAPAVAVALLLDRAGCALTACGAGQPTELPWALVRSGAGFHPVGLYGALIWLGAWLALRGGEVEAQPWLGWLVLLGALLLERTLAWSLGHDLADGLVASAALLLFVLAAALSPRRPAADGESTVSARLGA